MRVPGIYPNGYGFGIPVSWGFCACINAFLQKSNRPGNNSRVGFRSGLTERLKGTHMRASTTYYLFTGLHALGIGITVTLYVPFLLSIGLSLSEVSLVNAVFWMVIVLSELPTGMFADGRGRSFSLTLGATFWALGAWVYATAGGVWQVVFAEALCGVGSAFLSGADQAWVTDALKREGREDDLKKTFATSAIVRGGAMLLGGLLGVPLGNLDLRFIWVPGIFLGLLAALVAHKLMRGRGNAEDRVTELEALKKSWKLLSRDKELAWALAALLLFALVLPFNHYWSVRFEDVLGRSSLGWTWALLYAGLILAGMWVRNHPPGKSEASLVALSLGTAGLGLAFGASGFVPVMMSAVFIHEVARGAFDPLLSTFVQHRVESSHRATYGSLQSFLGKAGYIGVPLIVSWYLADKGTDLSAIPNVWMASGLLLAASALILWIFRPRREGSA